MYIHSGTPVSGHTTYTTSKNLNSPSILNQPFNYIRMTSILIMQLWPHFQLVQSVLKIGFALKRYRMREGEQVYAQGGTLVSYRKKPWSTWPEPLLFFLHEWVYINCTEVEQWFLHCTNHSSTSVGSPF